MCIMNEFWQLAIAMIIKENVFVLFFLYLIKLSIRLTEYRDMYIR